MDSSKHSEMVASLLALPITDHERGTLVGAIRSMSAETLFPQYDKNISLSYRYCLYEDAGYKKLFELNGVSYDHPFEYWRGISEELYASAGYSQYYGLSDAKKFEASLKQGGYVTSGISKLYKEVILSVVHHSAYGADILSVAKRQLREAKRKLTECYKQVEIDDDLDDYTTTTNNILYLDSICCSADEYIQQLESILPHCWLCLRELITNARLSLYVDEDLLQLIKEDNHGRFVSSVRGSMIVLSRMANEEFYPVQAPDDSDTGYHFDDDSFSCWVIDT